MVIKKNVVVILLIILFVGSAFSQDKLSSKEEKNMVSKAEFLYHDEDSKNIYKSMKLFEKLSKNKPSDPYYNLMVGICYSQFKDRNADALKKLLAVKKSNPEFNEVNFYLGRAYAVNNKFDDAIGSYVNYINSAGSLSEEKDHARQQIIHCENAKELLKDTLRITIENIGAPINTEFSEYVPIVTADEGMLIYTYRGKGSKGGLLSPTGKPDVDGQYYEDIMVSFKSEGKWEAPLSIGDNINTNGHDAGIAISVDGANLFVYKQDKKNGGDIYVSNLSMEGWSKPKRLMGGVNTAAWEGSATLTSDGKLLYFSSDREGGFGGRDLYSAALQADGSWGQIKNLGPVINTRFDDDAPFIHPDRRTMYFSSKGHNSMGDYDIFYTYLADEGWDKPENVGYPINTIDGDRYYVLSADAKTGYYSTGGRNKDGNSDIYMVTPGHFGKRPVLALVVGLTQADGKPILANIIVTNEETGEIEGRFRSDDKTGEYMLTLVPGQKYKISIEAEGHEPIIDYVDIDDLDVFVQVEHNYEVETQPDDFDLVLLQTKIDNERQPKEDSTSIDQVLANLESALDKDAEDPKEVVVNVEGAKVPISTDPCATGIVDFSWFVGKDLNDKSVYAKLLGIASNLCAEGLEFKVQIAAFRFPKNYKWNHLNQYGNPLVLDYPDRITRFTQGQFETLGKAEILRQKIIKSGQGDAWITPFFNGKRLLLEDLFKVNFYGKSIN